MEEGVEVDVQEECKECGMKRAVVRSGFLYCVECGMRSADSQPLIEYDRFDSLANKSIVTTKKIKKKENELSNMWSTWHAHNMILRGLVDEVCMCGAKESLSSVVLRLWSRWLRYHKVAFFAKTKTELPYLTLGFKQRDIQLLYNFRKRKSRRKIDSGECRDPKLALKKQATKNVNKLLQQEHEILLSTQKSEIMLSQNLEDVKLTMEEQPKKLRFSSTSTKLIKKNMTQEEYELHIEEGYCSTSCKCYKQPRNIFKNKITRTSIYNLYVLMYMGLLINNDDIYLGDVLRWCKEGHLTFGDYDHFFPEDMTIKSTDRLKLSSSMFSHKNIMITANRYGNLFNIKCLIKQPNIMNLVERYIEELELPRDLIKIIAKLLSKHFPSPPAIDSTSLPNYEAIALSYIIITLKMLFGLNDFSENINSSTARMCNDILYLNKCEKSLLMFDEKPEDVKKGLRRLFVFEDWMKYIEYRKICLSQCHYPTRRKYFPDLEDNAELFLFHRSQVRRKQPNGVPKNHCISIIKSLLHRIEDNYKSEVEYQFPIFPCSLTPMASNVKELLNWQYLNTEYTNVNINTDLLNEDFSMYSLFYLINWTELKTALRKKRYLLYIHNYIANPYVIVDSNSMYVNQSDVNLREVIRVFDCEVDQWDGILKAETLTGIHKPKIENSIVSLNGKISKAKPKSSSAKFISLSLYLCFENYWMKHYIKLRKRFTEVSFDEELKQNFPRSFCWLLKECASVAEISPLRLYHEVCSIEKQFQNIGKENNG